MGLISKYKKKFQALYTKNEIETEELKLLIGKQLSIAVGEKKVLNSIHDIEFKVFSQFGDDGIIQYLISKTDIPNKTFFEIGVANYVESNTRFLLMNNNWSGLIVDGSTNNIDHITKSYYFWKYDLKAICSFITKENINDIISKNGYSGETGLFHIDINGNDYWVWKELTVINPVIVIVEYNSILGVDRAITVPYNDNFIRENEHYSGMYFGTSLLAFCDLANEKGYSFVGCNSAGNNAYFVRNDKLTPDIKVLKPEEGYVMSKFREARNDKGELSYITGDERINLIKGMLIYNTRTGNNEEI